MKRTIYFAIVALFLLNSAMGFALALESGLIDDVQISLKSTENPARLEVSFDLTEPINLSQGNSDIIFEYFTEGADGSLKAIPYRKDKSWSGYLNSYDNYPDKERKYSSGTGSHDYPDDVPSAKLYTSVKSTSIDVASVTAVKITVLRSDGSGEKATVHIDGTVSDIAIIEASALEENNDLGIIMKSTTPELPVDTVLVASELKHGSVYEEISSNLTDVKYFVAFDITLKSGNDEVQPDGKVKISVPVPEHFSGYNLAVYRVSDTEGMVPCPTTVTTTEGIKYATFETEHFSVYVLVEAEEKETQSRTETKPGTWSSPQINAGAETSAEENASQKVEEGAKKSEVAPNPKTGIAKTINYSIVIIITSILTIILSAIKRYKE